jgi:Lipopolysaccharide-assembly
VINTTMNMPTIKKIFFFFGFCALGLAAISNYGCGHVRYSFQDVSIPDSIKIVKVNIIENRATYINPQIAPQLTDKLRQKIVSQTRLKQTNGDNADWEISATITDYSFSTSGISNQQSVSNRISVNVHVIINKLRDGLTKEDNISRNFDFPSTLSLQQAEANLLPEMIRGLADDIFNRLFSEW